MLAFSRFFQLICIGTPWVLLLVSRFAFRRRVPWYVLFAMACVIGYGFLIIAVQVREVELRRDLNRYDLDRNGIVSGSEMTAEAERAEVALTDDVGRAYAPFTGIPVMVAWTALSFAAFVAVEWLIHKTVRRLA